jgi:molybdopterin molybdotransferase
MTASTCEAHAASAEEVLALIRQCARPLATESVSIDRALGRVLRAPVCAPEDQPPFDRSAMDGFALRLDDAGTHFRILDEIRAGDWKPRLLQPSECVRIATGGALPGEGLQVVMKEDALAVGGQVEILRRSAECHIRFRGEDAQQGQELVAAGAVLSPGALALLASVGHTQPLVTRLPRVLHVATGNEIVPPDEAPAHGQIRDSNSMLVRAFLGQFGIEPRQLRVPEDEVVAKSEVRSSKSEGEGVDLLLLSGGASVGEHDFTRRLLEDIGWTILVSKTTTRPGKPLILATRGAALAFGLPGNPLAHFVCLHLYVRAALDTFNGRPTEPPFRRGVLAAELTAGGNARETYWPAQCRVSDGACALTPLRWSSSGDLTSLATANALIRVFAGCGNLECGVPVEFISTTPSP